jgi:hypothetical protein
MFNAAIEHFYDSELDFIFNECKKLGNGKNSIIVGYTLVENPKKSFEHHRQIFKNKIALKKRCLNTSKIK